MSIKSLYSVDIFFKSILDKSIYVREPNPSMVSSINNYVNFCKTALENTLVPTDIQNGNFINYVCNSVNPQVYTRTFKLPPNDYFNITWDISKANYIVKCNNIRLSQEYLPTLVETITTFELDKDNFTFAQTNNDMLILAETPFMEHEAIIIDGNHRAYAKYLLNKQTYINVYRLNVNLHLQAMVHDIHRKLFPI